MTEENKKKVLLVDDETILLDMYKTAFSPDNFSGEFLTADNSETALKIAKEQDPDLILLDILLGEKSGLDVIKQLKADEATKNIPIIALTNYDVEGAAKKAVAMGAKKYLIKSGFTPSALLREVKNNL